MEKNRTMAERMRKKQLAPMVERKADTTQNADGLDECIARQLEREKRLYPLRVSKTTVIYVPKCRQTKEYAERYRREKMGGVMVNGEWLMVNDK